MGELAGCMQSFAIQLKCSDEGFNFCVQGDTPANQLYFSYGYVEQARDNIIAAKPCGVSACMHSCCSTWTFLDGVLGNGCPSRAAWCNDRLFKSPPTGCIGCPLPCNSEVLQCSLTVGMSLLQAQAGASSELDAAHSQAKTMKEIHDLFQAYLNGSRALKTTSASFSMQY
eukprot:scaffold102257_cov15-Tisochrysis_lutea.AAC.1